MPTDLILKFLLHVAVGLVGILALSFLFVNLASLLKRGRQYLLTVGPSEKPVADTSPRKP